MVRSIRRAWLASSARGLGFLRWDSRSACRAAATSARRSSFISGDRCRRRNGPGGAGEDFVAFAGDRDGVLPLRRQAVVLGDDGPAVGQLADAGLAGVDHRLDREGHARLERHAGAGAPVVQDLRLLVELAADAVAAEFAHHRIAVLLGVRLDGGAQVAQPRARAHLADAEPHAFVRHLDQAARLYARLADIEHAARVAVKAVLDHGDVDVEDVAGLENPVAGDAMADLVVDRGADRLREGLVA